MGIKLLHCQGILFNYCVQPFTGDSLALHINAEQQIQAGLHLIWSFFLSVLSFGTTLFKVHQQDYGHSVAGQVVLS